LTYQSDLGPQREHKVWGAATGQDQVSLVSISGQFAFSPDGRRIAASGPVANSNGAAVKLWDIVAGRELLTLRTEGNRGQLVFTPDGARLFAVKSSSSYPGDLVQVWDATPLP
jgi:WD40 repeat protein